jgi:hypothetical protein
VGQFSLDLATIQQQAHLATAHSAHSAPGSGGVKGPQAPKSTSASGKPASSTASPNWTN